jgi:hypothetical protein
MSDGKAALELMRQSDYKPAVRSPFNIALLADKVWGDLIFEADCQQTGKGVWPSRHGLCLWLSGPESLLLYAHRHGCGRSRAQLLHRQRRAASEVRQRSYQGVDWGLGVWHHVRIARKASDGTVRVFFDDMEKPIMIGTDKIFGAGAIGFGSFDDTGKVTNIKVWSARVEEKKLAPFTKTP